MPNYGTVTILYISPFDYDLNRMTMCNDVEEHINNLTFDRKSIGARCGWGADNNPINTN